MGKVYLVGAGCGSLDLYTKKALDCITKADCLVYDSLVDENILKLCSKACRLIFVGKRAYHHTMKQEDINQLLVDLSYQYDVVVRLKGGDVYVFGRGGEEGEKLYHEGVDFEVVPGVSSVTAGLAYAGIPITHRGLSGGFQVYTASLKQHTKRVFDFSSMLDDYMTYVFLMGMSQVKMIIDGFLEAGKNPTTPVALLSHASLATQQCLVGTLETIVEQYENHPLPTPGIIVVGNVVKMREYLNFYEKKPLFSKSFLVTTVGDDHYLSERLRDLGGEVDEIKCGEIVYEDVELKLEPGYLIFTSQHGVHGFMKNYLKQYKDLRKLWNMKLICIGEKTNHVLNQYGLESDMIPPHANSDALDKALGNYIQDDGKVYLIHGDHIPNIKKYDETICVYANKMVDIFLKKKYYDYGLFTCASSVKRLCQAQSPMINCYVSIGPKTSQAIEKCFHKNALESLDTSKEAMVEMILRGDESVL